MWPIISFVVLWSIMIHGFSAVVMSTFGHFTRPEKERASLLGAEEGRLYGMANEDGELSDGEPIEQTEVSSDSDEGTM